MKFYIAGPMSGHKDFNFPAFDAAAASLRSEGHEVVNPADLSRESFKRDSGRVRPWHEYMRADIKQLVECDAIWLLRGWRESKGARLERHIASELGLVMGYEEEQG